MPLSQIKKTANEAEDMIRDWSERYSIPFRPGMNITGGEPFLRHDLFSVLEEMKSRGFEVHLLTNGTLVDRAAAERLAGIGVDGVQGSIEGPEYIHDSFRGDGAFAAAAAGIESLVECGLPVTLNVTLSRLNAGHVRSVIAIGSGAGIQRVGFSRLVPAGRGQALLSHMLSANELGDLYAALLSYEAEGIDMVTGDPVAGQMLTPAAGDAGDIAVSGCAAGVSGLTILPDGSVTPCRRLPLALGNVNSDSLRELWAASPVLEALRDRDRYAGKCKACSRWALCRGCRAIAYACSQKAGGEDFLADDPQCFIDDGT